MRRNTRLRTFLGGLACTVAVAALLFGGCERNTNNLAPWELAGLRDGDINNIIWKLSEINRDGRPVDMSIYPPFHLIFSEASFFGDDGCNLYGGLYTVRGDSIYPADVAQTLRLCIRATVAIDHLVEPFRRFLTTDAMHIFASDGRYSYTTDFGEEVVNSPLVGGWILVDATDPEFADIEQRSLIPTLQLKANREFKLVWDCGPDNIFGCNEIAGIFGIGNAGKMMLYQRGSQNNDAGLQFMHRMLAAETYSLVPETPKGATLSLRSVYNGYRYDFRAIVR